jgi:hypothetical protein
LIALLNSLLLVTHSLLLVTHSLLLVTHSLLLVTHSLLLQGIITSQAAVATMQCRPRLLLSCCTI